MEGRVSEIDVKADAGVSADDAGDARPRGAARLRRGQDRRAGRGRPDEAAQRRHRRLPAAGAALLRRHRRARRRLHHLQRVLDDRRPAPAGVRDAARARRLARAGAWSITGEALVMGILASRARALRRARGRGRRQPGVQGRRRRHPAQRARAAAAHHRHRARRGHRRHGALGGDPGARATRVPPMAALQEGAVLPPSRFARFTPYLAVAVAVLGAPADRRRHVRAGQAPRCGSAPSPSAPCSCSSPSPWSASTSCGPLARGLGWPLQKLSPVSGRLARDNSRRNPSRTAATAAALMIGLGVVVFVAVFAQGLKSSFIDSFDRTVRADYIVSGSNFMPIPNDTATRVQSVPGVADRRRRRRPAGAGGQEDVRRGGHRPVRLRARLELRLDRRQRRAAHAARPGRRDRRGADGVEPRR